MSHPSTVTERSFMSKCLVYVIAAALCELAPAHPQADQTPFSITIDAETNVFKAGSEVKIRLIFKNISSGEIPYERTPGTGIETNGEFFSHVEVRDSKGHLAPETRYYRMLLGKTDDGARLAATKKSSAAAASERPAPRPAIGGSFTGHLLKPGESREQEIIVSKLYNLSQPGQYTISASRRLSDITTDPNSKIVAKSNTLTISVTR